ncbi:DUF4386 family protein [Paractinoplanes globisporus]|uniref:DUF4386 family protein n=1 Tax=Paractinoplanes globisporus TaxID=113565 RepID=A0ABW6WJC8_9ACTN|nr:DUF4386 family protein [Actinoplanes globisporus]
MKRLIAVTVGILFFVQMATAMAGSSLIEAFVDGEAGQGRYLLKELQVVPNHLLWVYIPTAAGGLILTYLLFVSRLVPRPIAILGIVGYAALSLGVPLDLLGVLNLNDGSGLVLLAPGGLFEAVVLPIWLIAKGFTAPPSAKIFTAPALAPAS